MPRQYHQARDGSELYYAYIMRQLHAILLRAFMAYDCY